MRVSTSTAMIGRGSDAAAVPVYLRLAVPALAALLIVMACASADAQAEQATPRTNLQVTLWESGIAGEREALSELLFSFQHVNPDVIVCIEWKDAGLQADWVTRWCGDYRTYAPDLTVMGEQLAWQRRHDLLALPEDLARELRQSYDPAVMRRLPGPARGIPWRVSTRALYYRPDLLTSAELAVPASLEELAACAEALADPPHHYGLGVPRPLGGGEELLHALGRAQGAVQLQEAQAGPTLSDGSSEERRNTRPDYEGALESLVHMQSRGALQPEILTWSESELVELFAQGRLAMMIAPIGAAQMLRGMEDLPEWAVAPLPMADGGSGALETQWLVAFGDTDRQEAAVRLMSYLAEKESQRMLAMVASVPAMRELMEELSATPPWSAHIGGLREAEGVPLADWERLRPLLGDALVYALSGRKTPREALAEAMEIAE
jgi:ABC-type glycerol-3-phosphate transport system substrate-binding protein